MQNEYIRSPRIRLAGTITYCDYRRSFHVEVHRDVRVSPPHSHTCFELELIEAGEGTVTINGADYPLRPGAVHLADPTDFHAIRADTPLLIRTLVFTDTTDAGGQLLSSMTRWMQLTAADFGKMCALFTVIEAEQGNGATDGAAECCFDALMRIASRYLPEGAGKDDSILRALVFLREHFREDITEADVARAAGFAPTHLSRRFRRSVGIGVKMYLTSLRVAHARRLMDTTDFCIVDIAAESGFGSYSAFFRAFSAAAGISPAAYRRRKSLPISDTKT